MRQITRYLLIQLCIVSAVLGLALAMAIWLAQSLRFLDFIVNRGLPASSFLEFVILLLPSFLGIVLPIATAVSIIFVYYRLTQESELVVMRASGLSPFAVARPALIMALGVTALGYLITLYLVPLSYREFRDLQDDIRGTYASVLIQEGIFNSIGGAFTIYVRTRDEEGVLRGIIVQDNRNEERPVTLIAEQGALVRSDEGPRVLLLNGSRQEINRRTDEVAILTFDRYTVDLTPLSGSSKGRWRDPQERFLSELIDPERREGISQRRYDELTAELHQRLAEPLYVMAFSLVALFAVLGGEYNRRGRPLRLAAAAVVIAALQAVTFIAQDLAYRDLSMVPVVYLAPLGTIAVAGLLLFGTGLGMRRAARPA